MIPVSHTLKLYEVFNRYFKNNDDSRVAVQEIEGMVNTVIHSEKLELATKADATLLKKDMMLLKEDMTLLKEDMTLLKEDMMLLKEDVKEDISRLRLDLKEDIARVRIDMGEGFNNILKWIIVLMVVGFVSLIVGCIKLL